MIFAYIAMAAIVLMLVYFFFGVEAVKGVIAIVIILAFFGLCLFGGVYVVKLIWVSIPL